jgi:hypothetical protein
VFSGGTDGTSRIFVYSVEKSLRVLRHTHVQNPSNAVKVNVVTTLMQEGIVAPLIFGGE